MPDVRGKRTPGRNRDMPRRDAGTKPTQRAPGGPPALRGPHQIKFTLDKTAGQE